MFGVRFVKIDAGHGPVRVFDESPHHEVVHIMRNCPEGDRFIPEQLVNPPKYEKECDGRLLTFVYRGEKASNRIPRARVRLPGRAKG